MLNSLLQFLNQFFSRLVVPYHTVVTSCQLRSYPGPELFLTAFCVLTIESKERQTFADLFSSKFQVIANWVLALDSVRTLRGGGGGGISGAEPVQFRR